MDIICSLDSCHEEVVGTGVLMCDTFGAGIDWREGGYTTYRNVDDSSAPDVVILHPLCFEGVFRELARQEGATALMVAFGGISDLKAAILDA